MVPFVFHPVSGLPEPVSRQRPPACAVEGCIVTRTEPTWGVYVSVTEASEFLLTLMLRLEGLSHPEIVLYSIE